MPLDSHAKFEGFLNWIEETQGPDIRKSCEDIIQNTKEELSDLEILSRAKSQDLPDETFRFDSDCDY